MDKTMKYGLIIPSIEQNKDYVFGGFGDLGGEILVSDGKWDKYLPENEIQNLAMEPMACASFGTLNGVEMLERRIWGKTGNYSDRFLATASETTRQGNNPHKVAETLRKKGCVAEKDLPYTPEINTWEKFYAPISNALYTLAKQFTSEYSFGHEYVSTDPRSLMEALKYSPIGISVTAWYRDGNNGLYYFPPNSVNNHWCLLFSYEENEYWRVFDSYDNTVKFIKWDSIFAVAKRYTLFRQITNESWWEKFIKYLREAVGL